MSLLFVWMLTGSVKFPCLPFSSVSFYLFSFPRFIRTCLIISIVPWPKPLPPLPPIPRPFPFNPQHFSEGSAFLHAIRTGCEQDFKFLPDLCFQFCLVKRPMVGYRRRLHTPLKAFDGGTTRLLALAFDFACFLPIEKVWMELSTGPCSQDWNCKLYSFGDISKLNYFSSYTAPMLRVQSQ